MLIYCPDTPSYISEIVVRSLVFLLYMIGFHEHLRFGELDRPILNWSKQTVQCEQNRTSYDNQFCRVLQLVR